MQIDFNPYKDFIIIVGDNGSGKTTFCKMLISKCDNSNTIVLNSSRESVWDNLINPKNNIKPELFTKKFFEKALLKIAALTNDKALVILDDIDNYGIKKSEVLKSVVINARHLNLGLILMSRSLQDIPITLYKQAKYVFLGTQSTDYSIYYIATLIGMENAKKLKAIPKFTFGVYDSANRQRFDFIKLKNETGNL